jgi:hypothetical protein
MLEYACLPFVFFDQSGVMVYDAHVRHSSCSSLFCCNLYISVGLQSSYYCLSKSLVYQVSNCQVGVSIAVELLLYNVCKMSAEGIKK